MKTPNSLPFLRRICGKPPPGVAVSPVGVPSLSCLWPSPRAVVVVRRLAGVPATTTGSRDATAFRSDSAARQSQFHFFFESVFGTFDF